MTGHAHCKVTMLQSCKVAMMQSCKVAKLQSCKVARLQSCKVAKLQNCKVAKLQGKVFRLQTKNKVTDRQTNKQTDKVTLSLLELRVAAKKTMRLEDLPLGWCGKSLDLRMYI